MLSLSGGVLCAKHVMRMYESVVPSPHLVFASCCRTDTIGENQVAHYQDPGQRAVTEQTPTALSCKHPYLSRIGRCSRVYEITLDRPKPNYSLVDLGCQAPE